MNRLKELFIIGSIFAGGAIFGTFGSMLNEEITELGVIKAACLSVAAGFGAIAFHVVKKEKGEDGTEREVLALATKKIEELNAQVAALSTQKESQKN